MSCFSASGSYPLPSRGVKTHMPSRSAIAFMAASYCSGVAPGFASTHALRGFVGLPAHHCTPLRLMRRVLSVLDWACSRDSITIELGDAPALPCVAH